jgi:diguanylate cyclase (GGDEF)-like protein
MPNRSTALKHLLAVQLPLERVGPHLRHACRRAVRSGEPDRMLLHARVAAEDLIRRGELLTVAVDPRDGTAAATGGLYLVRGTSRVIDLGILEFQERGSRSEGFGDDDSVGGPAAGLFDLEELSEVMLAMEKAQDLEIGNPQSTDKGIILGNILKLVGRVVPEFRLFVMLPVNEALPPGQTALFSPDIQEVSGGWIGRRGEGHSVWIPDSRELPRHLRNLDGGPHGSHRGGGGFHFRAAVAVSLWEPDLNRGEDPPREAGLLFMVADRPLERDLMLRLAERISRFVNRRWQHLQAVNLRIHVDTLTGTFNRGYFEDQLALELERARRSEEPVTLVIADLDHFKSINDTYGHPFGDEVLRMVARRLHELLRQIDQICRIGGEEFGLILPATGKEAAQEVVTRLLDGNFRIQGGPGNRIVPVTFSFGAATFPHAGTSRDELYDNADEALYLSKNLGRNRCHIWSRDGDHVMILPTGKSD